MRNVAPYRRHRRQFRQRQNSQPYRRRPWYKRHIPNGVIPILALAALYVFSETPLGGVIGALPFLQTAAEPSQNTIVGRASVIDGDTLNIHGTRIRLNGIDAPESSQTCEAAGSQYRCGQKAAFALSDMIGSSTITCQRLDTDRYGRAVSRCTVNGMDIGQTMVRQGWALAYREYSTAYVADERHARAMKTGIWRGEFTNPADHRRR